MKYTFTNISETKRDEAMNAIMHAGGRVSANAFSIKGVEGRYEFKDGTLTVVIDDKPWLASWDMIEEKLNEYFNS
jgi:hypothetical protein